MAGIGNGARCPAMAGDERERVGPATAVRQRGRPLSAFILEPRPDGYNGGNPSDLDILTVLQDSRIGTPK